MQCRLTQRLVLLTWQPVSHNDWIRELTGALALPVEDERFDVALVGPGSSVFVSTITRPDHEAGGVAIGTDTFVFRDGKISLQTAYIVFA